MIFLEGKEKKAKELEEIPYKFVYNIFFLLGILGQKEKNHFLLFSFLS